MTDDAASFAASSSLVAGREASEPRRLSAARARTGTLAIVTLALSCVAFLVIGIVRINESPSASFEDTGPYLQGALIIKENGGFLTFIRQCVDGTFRVAEQQPAYLMMLSTVAARDSGFIRRAQLASLLIGLAVVLALFAAAKDRFGELTAASSSLLLALNGAFLVRASHVAVETLLMFFVVLMWWFTTRGRDNPRYWLAAGLAAGCAFMTKATALVLVPAFAAFALLQLRTAAVRHRHVWLFFAMFLLPCVPWIIRNLIVYQTPLYGGINDHAPWLDRWSQVSDPRYGLVLDWKQLTYTWTGLPTLTTYLADHSAADIWRRLAVGTIGEARLMVAALTMSISPLTSPVVGLCLLLAAAVGVLLDVRSARGQFTLMLAAAFALPYAWYYQVVPADRFVVPMVPVALVYAGYAFGRIADSLARSPLITARRRLDIWRIAAGCLAGSAAVACAVVLATAGGVPTIAQAGLEQDQEELFQYLRESTGERDGLFMAPTTRYFGYLWC